ncbi:hypothetical protein N0V87_000989 [Didymella glomerata]|uniref:Uncharacterized protein n=1 Tax=Didymella glomerata TaxID=749621 RepID=A0A9W8X884_9PLEO|nr:hypothetical protein N0V87_000989 [Didymella glomerata]
MTSANPILSKQAAPSVCGTIELKSGTSQKLYAGACYELQGPARGAHVSSACDCEFFPFETCNALVEPELDGSIQNAKGYFCQKS